MEDWAGMATPPNIYFTPFISIQFKAEMYSLAFFADLSILETHYKIKMKR